MVKRHYEISTMNLPSNFVPCSLKGCRCPVYLWGHAPKFLTYVSSQPPEPRHSEGGQPCHPADLDCDKRRLAISSQSTLDNRALLDCRMSHVYSPYALAASNLFWGMFTIYRLYQPSHLSSLQWTGANPCYACPIPKLAYYILYNPLPAGLVEIWFWCTLEVSWKQTRRKSLQTWRESICHCPWRGFPKPNPSRYGPYFSHWLRRWHGR